MLGGKKGRKEINRLEWGMQVNGARLHIHNG
jgi:hypothetical protein